MLYSLLDFQDDLITKLNKPKAQKIVYCYACFCYVCVCVCVCEGEVSGNDQLWRVPQCPRAVTTRRRHPLLHRR